MSEMIADNGTFEEALAALDRIVRELEDGHTGLEDSLSRYETGVALLKRCYAQLCEAEQRILTITGIDEDGRPVAHPFEHAATAEDRPTALAKKRIDPASRRNDG